MTRPVLIGCLAMAAVVLLSNILVQFLLGPWLTWGAFSYPLAFLVTDVMTRRFGAPASRKVVLAGFVTGLVASFIGTQIEGPFGPLVSIRVAVGSALAFLVGQLLDIALFVRLRQRAWWLPPFLSSTIGSAIDTALFFTIAFAGFLSFLAPGVDVAWANEPVPLLGMGPVLPLWVSLAVADFGVKLAVAVGALLPYRLLTARPARSPARADETG